MDWRDFIFGRKALGQAAGQPAPQPTPPPAQPAGIDMAALAQRQADSVLPQKPAAPMPKPGSLSEAARKRGQK